MWYVIQYKTSLGEYFSKPHRGYHDASEARKAADAAHAETGTHYQVIKVQVDWTTQTLAEAMT